MAAAERRIQTEACFNPLCALLIMVAQEMAEGGIRVVKNKSGEKYGKECDSGMHGLWKQQQSGEFDIMGGHKLLN